MTRIVVLLMVLAAAGCSTFATGRHSSELRADFSATDGLVYGHGSGDSERAALEAARRELAEQISVLIYSEVQSARRVVSRENGEDSSSEDYRDFMSSYTRLQLDDVTTDHVQRSRDGWYARVRIPQARMDEARQRMQRQAPALAYVHLLTSSPEAPGLRLRYALHGLQASQTHGITDELVYAPGISHSTTFRTYFLEQLEHSKDQLRLLPVRQGNQLRLTLIDRQHLTPQPGFVIRLGERQLKTNADGQTVAIALADLDEEFTPVLSGFRDAGEQALDTSLLHSTTLEKARLLDPQRSRVYVRSEPAGALITLSRDGEVLDERLAPAIFDISASNAPLTLRVTAPDNGYRDAEITLDAPLSGALYQNMVLTEKHLGHLDLSVPGSDYSITLMSARGDIISSHSNHVQLEAEVGHYDVQVMHTEQGLYQTLNDRLVVQHNGQIRRQYQRPRYRAPYVNGRLIDLSVGFGDDLHEDTELPYKQGGSGTTSDLLSQTSFHSSSALQLQLRTIKLLDTASLALAGAIDYRSYTFDSDDERDELSLDSFGVSAGLGFWSSQLIGSAAWLTANYNLSWYRWDSNLTHPAIERLDSFTRGYPYLEAGVHFTRFGFGVRLSDPEKAAPVLYFAIGAAPVERGFEHSASVSAQAGQHYQ